LCHQLSYSYWFGAAPRVELVRLWSHTFTRLAGGHWNQIQLRRCGGSRAWHYFSYTMAILVLCGLPEATETSVGVHFLRCACLPWRSQRTTDSWASWAWWPPGRCCRGYRWTPPMLPSGVREGPSTGWPRPERRALRRLPLRCICEVKYLINYIRSRVNPFHDPGISARARSAPRYLPSAAVSHS
jgi:hypothetical protein